MQVNNIEFNWLGHDGFKLVTADNKVVYIDPYKISEYIIKKMMQK